MIQVRFQQHRFYSSISTLQFLLQIVKFIISTAEVLLHILCCTCFITKFLYHAKIFLKKVLHHNSTEHFLQNSTNRRVLIFQCIQHRSTEHFLQKRSYCIQKLFYISASSQVNKKLSAQLIHV